MRRNRALIGNKLDRTVDTYAHCFTAPRGGQLTYYAVVGNVNTAHERFLRFSELRPQKVCDLQAFEKRSTADTYDLWLPSITDRSISSALGPKSSGGFGETESKIPVLSLIGEVDPMKDGVDQLQGILTNLKVVVIPAANHLTALRNPMFVKTLKEFLAAHPAKQ